MRPRDHVLGDPLVVEVEQGLVVHHDVAAPRPVLQLLDLGQELAVVGVELVVGPPVALDQRVADEQLARDFGVDPAVVDLPLGDDRHAVQRDLLVRHDGRLVLLPVRLAVRALDQVLGQRLDPLGLHLGVDPGPQPRGLHQLRRHQELRLLLEERRTGEDRELGGPGPQVLVLVGVLEADVREQAGQQRDVHVLLGGVDLVDVDAHALGDRAQLRVDVLPLADPQEVQVLLLAHPAEGGRAALLLLLADVAPHVQEREEIARLVLEPGVVLVGLRLLVRGPLARVLDGQRRRDDHDLADAVVLVGLDDHAGQARVHGELGELAAHRREPLLGVLLRRVQRAELLEQLDAVADVAVVRRVDEGELLDLAEAGRGHLEDDGSQVRAQDLGVRELGTGVEVVLGVEPDADAVRGAAAAALALVGAGLGDPFDGQALHLGAVAVAGDPGGARVDHVLDARDGQGGLGDVRGQDDPAPRVLLEDAVLLGVGEAGVQGQDLGEAKIPLVQGVRRVADLALAGEEDQDVAGPLGLEFVHGLADRRDLVPVGVLGILLQQGPVADLDGVRTAADLDDRGVPEVPGEPLRVDRRRGDHDLEVGALRQQLGQVAQQEVDVEGPLVGLVDDDRVVRAQLAVRLDLGEQDAVGHQLDEGRVLVHLVGEADLPADGLPDLGLQLLGDPLRDRARGDPAGLGVPDHAPDAAAQLHADLGDLRGFAGTGLTGDDHDLVVAYRLGDLVLLLADGQVLGIRDLRHPRGTAGQSRGGLLGLRGDLVEHGLLGLGLADAAGAFEAAAEAVRVTEGDLTEKRLQGGEGSRHT